MNSTGCGLRKWLAQAWHRFRGFPSWDALPAHATPYYPYTHPYTRAHAARRAGEGRSEWDTIRCLKHHMLRANLPSPPTV